MTDHSYRTSLQWSGSTGAGYRGYSRAHRASAAPCATPVALSADPHFRGAAELLNPEQLLVMAASSCQLLSFLAVAARNHVDVRSYDDVALATMSDSQGPMSLESIALAPVIGVAPGTDHGEVTRLVHQAHTECYIANSLTAHVTVEATVVDVESGLSPLADGFEEGVADRLGP